MRLKSIHHVSFAVTDLAQTRRFAEDFGLITVSHDGDRLFMRTAGGDAWSYTAVQAEARGFFGLGFAVEDESDLREAVEQHGATPIRELTSPGGGLAVTLTNPDGLAIDLVTGVAEHEPTLPTSYLRINSPGERTRYTDPQVHSTLGPATLYRLGHVGLFVKDFATTAAWYETVLGMKRSDTMHVPGQPEKFIGGFFRIDRGKEWVDHHALFLGNRGSSDAHHISFEAKDYEAQFRAHRYLEKQGWELNWGVGRHPLGSHVFDVWFDPDRYRFESFSDTDLVNCDHVPGHYDAKTQELDMWSSDTPERYFA
jgi:catechol 2,3-dioxygenase-like lactoylglutathione lyase family enzyme